MKNNLAKIKSEIENYAKSTNKSELKVLEQLTDYYFNKKVKDNLKLYKKGEKKVSDITKDLKISPRKLYAILKEKNIAHKTYNKTKTE